jgi:hypothetical protein
MASEARALLVAVQALLDGIDGAPDYAFSFADAVTIGVPTPNRGAIPGAYLWIDRVDLTHSDELGSWRQQATIGIQARVPHTTATDPQERHLIGLDALDDIVTALRADRTVGGRVLDSDVTATAFDGGEAGLPGCVVVEVQMVAWWIATAHEGV